MGVPLADSVRYPIGKEEALRCLSVTLGLVGTTVLGYCFAGRSYNVRFTISGLRRISMTKCLLLLLFLDSWLFVFIAAVLVNGIGLSLNASACTMGIVLCIVFYCASKLFIYLFLLEKIYVVWPHKSSRFSSRAYRVGLTGVVALVIIFVSMITGRIAFIREDGQCVIGLHRLASITSLLMDLFANILLTSMFLWPLWRSNLLSPNIKRVATRTLVSSMVSLTFSVANMAVLIALKGHELAFICLAFCSTDVVVNAVSLYWLTHPHASADCPQVDPPNRIRSPMELTRTTRTEVGSNPESSSRTRSVTVASAKTVKGEEEDRAIPPIVSLHTDSCKTCIHEETNSRAFFSTLGHHDDPNQGRQTMPFTSLPAVPCSSSPAPDQKRHSVGVFIEPPANEDQPSFFGRLFGRDKGQDGDHPAASESVGRVSLPSAGRTSFSTRAAMDSTRQKRSDRRVAEELSIQVTVDTTTYMEEERRVGYTV